MKTNTIRHIVAVCYDCGKKADTYENDMYYCATCMYNKLTRGKRYRGKSNSNNTRQNTRV